jgi:hypothetical protein
MQGPMHDDTWSEVSQDSAIHANILPAGQQQAAVGAEGVRAPTLPRISIRPESGLIKPLCFVLCALCFVLCALCFVLCALWSLS